MAKQTRITTYINQLETGDVKMRRLAARRLGKPKAGSAVPALINALQDTDRFVRADAAGALGKIGHPDAISALSECISREKSISVVRSAAESIGILKNPIAVPSLVSALKRHKEHTGVQQDVKQAVFTIGPTAAPYLARILAEEPADPQAFSLLHELHFHYKGFSLAGPSSTRLAPVLREVLVDEETNLQARIHVIDRLLLYSSMLAVAGMAKKQTTETLCIKLARECPDPLVRQNAERIMQARSLLRASDGRDPNAGASLLRATSGKPPQEDGSELMRGAMPANNESPIPRTWWKRIFRKR